MSIAPPLTALLRRLLAVFLIAIALPAHAQNAALGDDLSLETLKRRLVAAEAATDLEPAVKAKTVENYRAAVSEMEMAAAARADAAELKRRQPEAPAEIQKLERALRTLEAAKPPPLPNVPMSVDALEEIEAKARVETEAARVRVSELDRAFNDAAVRPLDVRRQQAVLRRELAELDTQIEALAARDGTAAAIADSERALIRAREESRQARLEKLEQELVYQPAQVRIIQLRRDVARAELEARNADLKTAGMALEQRHGEEVAKAREEAARAKVDGGADPLAAVAAVGSEHSARLAEVGLALNRALLDLSQRRQEIGDVEQRLRDARRRAADTRGSELATLLVNDVRTLPGPEKFTEASARRSDALAQITRSQIEVARERQQLADLDTATAAALASIEPATPPERRAALARELRRELASQRQTLDRLEAQLATYAQTLRDTDEIEAELLTRSRAVRNDLIKLLYWVPLSPLSPQTFADLPASIGWLLSPTRWQSALNGFARGARRHAFGLFLAVVTVLGLLAVRGRLKRRLVALAPREIGFHRYRIVHALAALAIGLLLALPLPLALWSAGALLVHTPEVSQFGDTLGVALRVTALPILIASAFKWLLDDRGVGINHFGWRRELALEARRGVRRLMVAYVPLAFIGMLASADVPEPVRQSVGRLAFIASMLVVAYYWARIMRPALSLTRLAADPNAGAAMRAGRALLSRGMVIVPVALAVTAAAGFYFAAGSLWLLILLTVVLIFLAAILYELLSLFMALQRRRLAAVEAQSEAGASGQAASVEGPAVAHETIDVDAIDTQTRQLLNMLITVALLAGIYLVWRGSIPFFDVIGERALWTYNAPVDGRTVTRSVTLGGLLLAFLVLVITAVATKNIGGMLDIILLRRLELQADANYAIKTVTRYVMVGIGLVLASQLVGFEWSKAQWLVAALGVGLGFGLQEIVANFVSGLIVLGERPIRIGDVVSVNEVSGTVTRIRARATLVTDFENKEVLIPNKAFITERVVNWTLSSGVTRLLIKVGVAYGTDPESVQKILTDIVRAHPEVLADPPPSVFFTLFGESSLDFEVRVFVDGIAKRLQTTHDLNVAIARAFAANGIEIPFPQRDLHVRTAEGLRGLVGGATEAYPGATR